MRDLVTFFTIQKTWKTRIEECLLKLKPEVRLIPATLLKVALPHACFPRFIHCTNGTELHKACNFIKKETLAQVFSCEFYEISKNTFFTEHPSATASKNYIWPNILSCDYSMMFQSLTFFLERICFCFFLQLKIMILLAVFSKKN